jgi:hypothetical protein
MLNDFGADGVRNERDDGAVGVTFRPKVFGTALSPCLVAGEAYFELPNVPLFDAYFESLKPPLCAYELPE